MGVEPKIGGKPPKWMVKIMENPIKMDDLWVPSIFGNTHIYFKQMAGVFVSPKIQPGEQFDPFPICGYSILAGQPSQDPPNVPLSEMNVV